MHTDESFLNENEKDVSTSVVFVDVSPRFSNSFPEQKQGENTEHL